MGWLPSTPRPLSRSGSAPGRMSGSTPPASCWVCCCTGCWSADRGSRRIGLLPPQPQPEQHPGCDEEGASVLLQPLRARIVAEDLVEVAVQPVAHHEDGTHLPGVVAEGVVGE